MSLIYGKFTRKNFDIKEKKKETKKTQYLYVHKKNIEQNYFKWKMLSILRDKLYSRKMT